MIHRLIVNADNYARDSSVHPGIHAAQQEDIVTTTTTLMNAT